MKKLIAYALLVMPLITCGMNRDEKAYLKYISNIAREEPDFFNKNENRDHLYALEDLHVKVTNALYQLIRDGYFDADEFKDLNQQFNDITRLMFRIINNMDSRTLLETDQKVLASEVTN